MVVLLMFVMMMIMTAMMMIGWMISEFLPVHLTPLIVGRSPFSLTDL